MMPKNANHGKEWPILSKIFENVKNTDIFYFCIPFFQGAKKSKNASPIIPIVLDLQYLKII